MPPKRNHNRSKESHNKNNSKEASEVNAMASCVLPRDMIIAVLSRLPVKSLVRFKCVCKPWSRLVSNPNFIKIHTLHSSQTPRAASSSVQSHLLTCPVLGIDPNKVTPVDPGHPCEVFLDHCNGLICMGRPSFTDKIILWNPATDLWKVLPDSRSNFGAAQMVSIGFGCNADGDDFKVVRIICLKGKKMKVGVEVYSSKLDCWRTMDLGVGFKFRVMNPKNHVIVNGNPYWVACFAERLNAENGVVESSRALLGFDATNMKFKVVALPRIGKGPLPFMNWERSIAVVDCVKKDEDGWLQGIDVWCYDDSEGEWTRKKRFEVTTHGLLLQVDRCLDCSSSCDKIVGGCTNGKLFIFDTRTGRVVVSELKKDRGCSFQIFAYDESLAFVKGMRPTGMSDKKKEEFDTIDGFFISSLRHTNGEIACYYALA